MYNRPWCESTLEKVYQLLLEDLPLPPDVPGGMPEYRRSLVTSFFFKFYLSVCSRLGGKPLPDELVSATQLFSREPVKSTQGFQTVPKDQSNQDSVGRPMMHLSALQQATGEARYISSDLYIYKCKPCKYYIFKGNVLARVPCNITDEQNACS